MKKIQDKRLKFSAKYLNTRRVTCYEVVTANYRHDLEITR